MQGGTIIGRACLALVGAASCGFGGSDDGNAASGDPCVDRVVEDWNLQPVRSFFPGIEQDITWLTAGTDKGVPGRLPATLVWPAEMVGGDSDGAKVYAPMEIGTFEFQLILEGCPNQSETFTFDVVRPRMPSVAIAQIPTTGATAVAWSPDGTRYAATLSSTLVLYDAAGTPLDAITGPFGKGMSFSPDGSMIGVGLGTSELAPGDLRVGSPLVAIDTDKLVPVTLWPNGQSSGSGFSADGKYYYTVATPNGSIPFSMRLNLETGGRDYLNPLGAGDTPPDSAEYLRVWSGVAWDGSNLFEPNTGMLFNTALFMAGQGAISPETNSAIMTNGSGAYRWQIFPMRRENSPEFLDQGGGESYVVSPDGLITVTLGNLAGTPVFAPTLGGTGRAMLSGPSIGAAFSPDGQTLVLATEQGVVRVTRSEIVALLAAP